jgi:hypothetical protein
MTRRTIYRCAGGRGRRSILDAPDETRPSRASFGRRVRKAPLSRMSVLRSPRTYDVHDPCAHTDARGPRCRSCHHLFDTCADGCLGGWPRCSAEACLGRTPMEAAPTKPALGRRPGAAAMVTRSRCPETPGRHPSQGAGPRSWAEQDAALSESAAILGRGPGHVSRGCW